MKDRLQQLMQAKGISSSKLGELLNVQPSGISHILSGRNKPSMDFVEKLFTVFPDVNPEWFILGKGSMLQGVEQNIETPAAVDDNISNTVNPEPELFVDTPQNTTVIDKAPTATTSTTETSSSCDAVKRVVKVMVFYSDHTVEVFDHIS